MLAIAWCFTLVRLCGRTGCDLANRLGNLSLNSVEQEIDVISTGKLRRSRHHQFNPVSMLLVSLVGVNESLAVFLIRQQYLCHAQILDGLIEVEQGSEGLGTPRESFVTEVSLLSVSVVEDFTVFKDTCAIVYHFLPHLEANSRQRTVSVEHQHVPTIFERITVVLVGTLVEASL